MTCPCTLGRGHCNCGLEYQPAGRPLIPGQDATPHDGKDYAWLNKFFTGIVAGIVMAAIFWPMKP